MNIDTIRSLTYIDYLHEAGLWLQAFRQPEMCQSNQEYVMRARDLKPLIGGSLKRIEFTFDNERIARAKLNLAYKALRYAKDHYYNGLNGPAVPAHWLNALSAFIELDRPNVIVFGVKDPTADYRKYEYRRVLALAVGDSCIINVRGRGLDTVKSRLKQLAADVEADLGVRPCWTARYGDSIKQGPNPFVITRLPDDYDPATGKPRETLTGARKEAQKTLWGRINLLIEDYETGAVYEAILNQRPVPPIPRELVALLAEHRPSELAALQRRVEEARRAA